jgi:hypothetical protein
VAAFLDAAVGIEVPDIATSRMWWVPERKFGLYIGNGRYQYTYMKAHVISVTETRKSASSETSDRRRPDRGRAGVPGRDLPSRLRATGLRGAFPLPAETWRSRAVPAHHGSTARLTRRVDQRRRKAALDGAAMTTLARSKPGKPDRRVLS